MLAQMTEAFSVRVECVLEIQLQLLLISTGHHTYSIDTKIL